jgi:hypothetical protein
MNAARIAQNARISGAKLRPKTTFPPASMALRVTPFPQSIDTAENRTAQIRFIPLKSNN